METATKNTLTLLAQQNWRGIPTSRLIYVLQDLKDEVALPDTTTIHIEDAHAFYCEQLVEGIEKEILRRRDIQYQGIMHTNAEIIQTIKNAIRIEDVLEWYTEVFLHKRTWTYRCTLHGADRHPSGVIYRDDNRCWCFVCQKGGDVFDVVQLFERVTLPAAIEKLARHIGLDTKPLIRRKRNLKDISA